MERDAVFAEPALAGANSACFIHEREFRDFPADPAPHVAAVGKPDFLPLIVIVVSWATLLFFGFGVTSGLNPTSLGALAFGSFAVASAIFLILELNQPFTGLFRIPSAPIERAIAALGSPD